MTLSLEGIDDQVLTLVRRERRALRPTEVVDVVLGHSTGLSDVDVKRAMWRLISNGRLQFSPDQLVSVVSNPRRRRTSRPRGKKRASRKAA